VIADPGPAEGQGVRFAISDAVLSLGCARPQARSTA